MTSEGGSTMQERNHIVNDQQKEARGNGKASKDRVRRATSLEMLTKTTESKSVAKKAKYDRRGGEEVLSLLNAPVFPPAPSLPPLRKSEKRSDVDAEANREESAIAVLARNLPTSNPQVRDSRRKQGSRAAPKKRKVSGKNPSDQNPTLAIASQTKKVPKAATRPLHQRPGQKKQAYGQTSQQLINNSVPPAVPPMGLGTGQPRAAKSLMGLIDAIDGSEQDSKRAIERASSERAAEQALMLMLAKGTSQTPKRTSKAGKPSKGDKAGAKTKANKRQSKPPAATVTTARSETTLEEYLRSLNPKLGLEQYADNFRKYGVGINGTDPRDGFIQMVKNEDRESWRQLARELEIPPLHMFTVMKAHQRKLEEASMTRTFGATSSTGADTYDFSREHELDRNPASTIPFSEYKKKLEEVSLTRNTATSSSSTGPDPYEFSRKHEFVRKPAGTIPFSEYNRITFGQRSNGQGATLPSSEPRNSSNNVESDAVLLAACLRYSGLKEPPPPPELSSTSSTTKRRRNRNSLSCVFCKKRKRKCVPANPGNRYPCTGCMNHNVPYLCKAYHSEADFQMFPTRCARVEGCIKQFGHSGHCKRYAYSKPRGRVHPLTE